MEQKLITMDGIEFQLSPIQVRKALKLDKKVMSLILPAFKVVGDLDLKNVLDIDIGVLLEAFSDSLDKLKDDEYESFLIDMFSTVKAIKPGAAPCELDSEGIDTIFQGKLLTVYKLLIEVMRYNKFTPFELGGAGVEIQKMFSSEKPAKNGKTSGETSEGAT